MLPPGPRAVVHLELHTGDRTRALEFYEQLFDWRPERITTRHGLYVALGLGGGVGGGVVECATDRPLWVPYAEVEDVADATARAERLGATVLLGPREGPGGRRSVVAAPAAGEIALWEPKR